VAGGSAGGAAGGSAGGAAGGSGGGSADAGTCGDGIRNPPEQCDDGNLVNLDGCGATCRFELSHRMSTLVVNYTSTATCPLNQFGSAFQSIAQGTLQQALDTSVNDGSTSIVVTLLDLNDLSGMSQGALTGGFLNAPPVMPFASTTIDDWFTASVGELDAARLPTSTLSGTLSARLLSLGPGTITPAISLFGAPAAMRLSTARVSATLNGPITAPAVSTGGPPGHLPTESLDPSLMCVSSGSSGSLCGNLSATSLAKIPLPTSVTSQCTVYTSLNSLLDLIVGGCSVFTIQVVKPTQPDQVDPSAPVAGAGGPYTLSANANQVVDACRDKNNAVVPISTCLDSAAYSSSFSFTTVRSIVK
jgi:cysteine-rich repeat protein